MIVNPHGAPRPVLTLDERKTAIRAFRNRLISGLLTVTLLPTAAVALVLALSAAMNHGETNWWLVGYALLAGGWGMHRAADAPVTPVPDSQLTEWWRAATAAEQEQIRQRWAEGKEHQ